MYFKIDCFCLTIDTLNFNNILLLVQRHSFSQFCLNIEKWNSNSNLTLNRNQNNKKKQYFSDHVGVSLLQFSWQLFLLFSLKKNFSCVSFISFEKKNNRLAPPLLQFFFTTQRIIWSLLSAKITFSAIWKIFFTSFEFNTRWLLHSRCCIVRFYNYFTPDCLFASRCLILNLQFHERMETGEWSWNVKWIAECNRFLFYIFFKQKTKLYLKWNTRILEYGLPDCWLCFEIEAASWLLEFVWKWKFGVQKYSKFQSERYLKLQSSHFHLLWTRTLVLTPIFYLRSHTYSLSFSLWLIKNIYTIRKIAT